MKINLCSVIAASLLIFWIQLAEAETETEADQAEAGQKLPAVTVTGERIGSFNSDFVQVGTFRDMAPIDVPQTSNVITREVLDAQATTGIFGALRNTAGVTRSQLNGSTYDNIAIRGILVENRSNYRLNGSLPIINLIDIPMENKERVEVLKGASSLYYGFVPPSGIVNLVTKRASKDPVSNVSLMVNMYGGANSHIDLGRRFGSEQQFGARINLLAGREDIGIRNFSGHRALVSGAFDWRVTDKLSLKLDVEHYRKEVSEQAAIRAPAAINGVITLPPVPDARRNLAGEWQKYDAEATNLLLRADYAISDNWGLLFEIGRAETRRDRNFSQFQDYNLVTGAGTLRTFFNRGQNWDNQNIRTEVFGRFPGQFITHEVSVGFTGNERRQNPRTSSTFDTAQNLYNPIDIAHQSPTTPFSANRSKITDLGVYISDRILIGSKLQIMLGARGSFYKSVAKTTHYKADRINPSLSLMYKPIPNVSMYASYIEGVEESGQAPANRANNGEILAPAVSKQKEVGVKALVAQGILLQVAYFDIKRASTTVDAANRFVLNGMAQYSGFELSASGEVTKQLSLIGSALFMESEQLNKANAETFGKIPDNTPKRTASLFAEYRPTSIPGLALSSGVYYVGRRPVNSANQAFVDDYAILSLGARYTTRIAGKRATVQAVVDNVTNSNYWSTAGNGLLGVGAPVMFKIVSRVEF
ncbi:TonB-dependent siderophore receptor [Nitrosomonas eutropha]|uniref:Iron complex outermembrane receptor protein n=2 Tax=Nitrosomonas eutropha TaxID=916 RepID=A0ABX5M3U8_9PROT|nr:TonB-dependent siderophore receptor [Nitrosomonas eutropha]ABI60192.1 TonB-dependent siderophore receptor [Nitrosomonas eutropha C91]PXV75076.1 iron complex outermembrane receptor protein [Nitrosomonas eutropha]